MKKIGIFCGAENTFPNHLIAYINQKRSDIQAEIVKVGYVTIDDVFQYNVIFDRVSHQVSMYQSILKQCALQGIIVINNPYLKCLEDLYFQFALAKQLGFNVPKTVILPTKEHQEGTTSETYKNLVYPLNWEALFDHIGFPFFMKLNKSNSSTYSFKIYNPAEFFSAYDVTGNKQMILQQVIDFDSYYRVFAVGKKHLKIINFDPNKPLHLRYSKESLILDPKFQKKIMNIIEQLCTLLDLNVNAVDIAISNSDVYLLDFYNVAPIVEPNYFSNDDYNWLIYTIGDFLISIAENPPKDLPSPTPWAKVKSKLQKI
ncbi:MAG: ATP-grasp domain-containing protein [Candidatus Kapaibacteriales bacterium]